eukprot:22696_1
MQYVLETICNIRDERIKRKISAFRASLFLFLNVVTDIAVIANDWNLRSLYIWLLVFFNFHGCLQLSISIHLRHDSYILSILGFFGIGQVASLVKLWNNIEDNHQYRQWMEVCWIQTTMITIPSIALQIWSLIAFTDITLESYSAIKIISISLGILSIGPTIVSLEKFMNEHAQSTLKTIKKNMKQQKEVSKQLMADVEDNAFIAFEDEEETKKEHHESDSDDDGFDLDADDGYARNQLDHKQSASIPAMNETESRSRYDTYYKLKKPSFQVIQYSSYYYYGFVSLIPSDFVIRVVSIGFLQRILFGDVITDMKCVLWYAIILYFVIWRFTYSESYGEFCWGYEQYERLSKWMETRCPLIGVFVRVMVVICTAFVMPSGYMYYGSFHRELYPKLLILVNNTIQLILFIVFMYVFNRHLDGHHHEKIIQYDMEDKYEDLLLILWQVVLCVAWLIYFVAMYLFYNEGTKHLEEQLETLIPSYEDAPEYSF